MLTLRLSYSDTRLQHHNLIGPNDDVITTFGCIWAHAKWL